MSFKLITKFVFILSPFIVIPDFVPAQQPAGTHESTETQQSTTSQTKSLEKCDQLGSTKNVHRVGNLFLAGQFSAADLKQIKAAGIQRIITLRTDGEIDWDEKRAVEAAGLEFESFPLSSPESLTDDTFEKLRFRLQQPESTLLHCGMASRVSAVWLAHRVLDEGVPLETAQAEAQKVGFVSPGLMLRTLNYIRSQFDATEMPETSDDSDTTETEASVRPGINEKFLDPELDPAEWQQRFEIESREIYAARNDVLRACEIQPGSRVADIGAGTGIYTRLFANQVGPSGWVFAIDISPRLIEHINRQSTTLKQKNVTAILCQENSTNLPPDSIDFAFICDTYHHFEFPKLTLASLHEAMKMDGRLVVIDFIRIEGESRPWTIEHVRAGQEVFTAEIEAAGFKLLKEEKIPGFSENYFLIFQKQKASDEK